LKRKITTTTITITTTAITLIIIIIMVITVITIISKYVMLIVALGSIYRKVQRPGLASSMYLTSLEVYNYWPFLELLTCCRKCCVSKLQGVVETQLTLPSTKTGENLKY